MGQTYTKKKEKKKALRSHWLKSGLHFLSFCHVSPVTTSRTAIHQREGQPRLLPEDHHPPTVSTSSRSPWKPPTHPSSPVHQPWPILFPRRTQRLHQLPLGLASALPSCAHQGTGHSPAEHPSRSSYRPWGRTRTLSGPMRPGQRPPAAPGSHTPSREGSLFPPFAMCGTGSILSIYRTK